MSLYMADPPKFRAAPKGRINLFAGVSYERTLMLDISGFWERALLPNSMQIELLRREDRLCG